MTGHEIGDIFDIFHVHDVSGELDAKKWFVGLILGDTSVTRIEIAPIKSFSIDPERLDRSWIVILE